MRKAFSFLEVIITLVILALIGAFLALGAAKVFDNFSDKNAKDRLLILSSGQLQFYENRGRFATSPDELRSIEPNFDYALSGQPSQGEMISSEANSTRLGLATLSSSGKCFLLSVFPPSSNLDNLSGVLESSSCYGGDALTITEKTW